MAHTCNPSIQEPKGGRFWWVLSWPSWAYRVRFCLKQWHTYRTQEPEGSFHFCSPFRFLTHSREHPLRQTVCMRAPRAAVCLMWLCDSLSYGCSSSTCCMSTGSLHKLLFALSSFLPPPPFLCPERISLFNISGWPETCTIDQAGLELTGTCLPLLRVLDSGFVPPPPSYGSATCLPFAF